MTTETPEQQQEDGEPLVEALDLELAAAPTEAVESVATWRRSDRLAYYACWAVGIGLCAIAGAILLFMLIKGIQYVTPGLITDSPAPEADQEKSGGIKDPIIGTLVIAVLGTSFAVPFGVAVATWLVEFGRPAGLARAVESAVEIVAGTPSIVLAIFGLSLFTNGIFGFLSFTAEGGAVSGQSFLTAGIMMSLIALPLVVGATREALMSIPSHVREASYALGKTKAATIHRVLLPQARPAIGTGAALGMGRIIGDTAIIVVLLGATLQLEPNGEAPGLKTLTGTGSTLTSYVFASSPAGEGNAPEKAYAAAFVLLMIVVLLNLAIGRIGRGSLLPGVRLRARKEVTS